MVCASGVRSTVGGSHPCGPRRALWKPQMSRHCCRIHTIVRWIDRFEWDHPRQRVWRRARAGARSTHTHTATRTRGRSSDWCQRISPQRPKAQTVIPSVAILTGASAHAATHTHATRTRGAKGWPRKVKRFALFRRQRGSDTGEYRLRPYGAVGGVWRRARRPCARRATYR